MDRYQSSQYTVGPDLELNDTRQGMHARACLGADMSSESLASKPSFAAFASGPSFAALAGCLPGVQFTYLLMPICMLVRPHVLRAKTASAQCTMPSPPLNISAPSPAPDCSAQPMPPRPLPPLASPHCPPAQPHTSSPIAPSLPAALPAADPRRPAPAPAPPQAAQVLLDAVQLAAQARAVGRRQAPAYGAERKARKAGLREIFAAASDTRFVLQGSIAGIRPGASLRSTGTVFQPPPFCC